MVQNLIDGGADIEAKSSSGDTPLMQALKSDQDDAVDTLIEAGASADALDNDEATVLQVAITSGKPDVAIRLLDNIADSISAKNSDGETALLLAIKEGQNDLVQALVDKNCDLTIADNSGKAAIHHSIESSNVDLLEILIAAGADVDQIGPKKIAPVFMALKSGSEEIFNILFSKGASLSIHHTDGSTPLTYCLKKDMLDLALNTIPSAGDAAGFAAKNGDTPLTIAASRAQSDVIEVLLSAGVEIDEGGVTPLHSLIKSASKNDDDEVEKSIRLLIEKGASISAKNNEGQNVLTASFAAEIDSDVINGVIIPSAGESAVDSDDNGVNPLFLAAEKELLSTIEALVSSGADVLVKNSEGKSVLSYVLSSNLGASSKSDVISALVEVGGAKLVENADEDEALPLHLALASKDTKDIGKDIMLPVAEESVNAMTKRGCSLLWTACKSGDLDLAEALIEKGAEIDGASEKDGSTPLQVAIGAKNADITSLLLSKGADANIKDKKGSTCLEIAFKAKAADVIDSLLENGADPNASVDGVSLVSHAVQNGSTQILQSLIDNNANLDVTAEDGSTALLEAFKLGKKGLETFKLLLENKADPNIKFPKNLFGKDGEPIKKLKGKFIVKENNGVCIRKSADLKSIIKKFLPCNTVCKVDDSKSADGVSYLKIENAWAPSESFEPLDEHAGKGIADGTNLILAAVQLKKGEYVDALLEAGADIKAENDDGLCAEAAALSADRELPKWDKSWPAEQKAKIQDSTPVCAGKYKTTINGDEVEVDVKIDKKKITTKFLSGEMKNKPYFRCDLGKVMNKPDFPLSFKASYSEDGKNKDTYITLMSSSEIVVHRYEENEDDEKTKYDHCKMTYDGEPEDVFSALNEELKEAYNNGITYGEIASKMID